MSFTQNRAEKIFDIIKDKRISRTEIVTRPAGLYFGPSVRFWGLEIDKCTSSRGRVVKALDLKSNGVSPRRFEPCSQRTIFAFYAIRGKDKSCFSPSSIWKVNYEMKRRCNGGLLNLLQLKCNGCACTDRFYCDSKNNMFVTSTVPYRCHQVFKTNQRNEQSTIPRKA